MASTVVNSRLHTVVANVDTADVNTGYCLIAPKRGKAIYVVAAKATASGTASVCTGVLLQDAITGSPVVVGEFLQASLVSATEFTAYKGEAGFTAGVAWQAALTTSLGLYVYKDGTLTTTTAIKFVVSWIWV